MKISGNGNTKSNINGKWHKTAQFEAPQPMPQPMPKPIPDDAPSPPPVEDIIEFYLTQEGIDSSPEIILDIQEEIADLGLDSHIDDEPLDIYEQVKWGIQKWQERRQEEERRQKANPQQGFLPPASWSGPGALGQNFDY